MPSGLGSGAGVGSGAGSGAICTAASIAAKVGEGVRCAVSPLPPSSGITPGRRIQTSAAAGMMATAMCLTMRNIFKADLPNAISIRGW